MRKTIEEYKIDIFNNVRDNGSASFLKNWQAERYINSGAHGAVYEAVKINGDTEQRSAIKIIGPLKKRALMEYKNEVDSMSKLKDCPYIVHISDHSIVTLNNGIYDDFYFVLRMELLQPLPETDLNEKTVVKLGNDICKALIYCHSLSPAIIHCDIKPSNILVDSAGNYRLADFGQARSLRNTGTSSGMHGTPNYMAPEMFNRKGYDTRSDIYSLGYTMYALLNNRKVPYEELGLDEAMRRKCKENKLPPLKNVSKGLQVILNRMCHYSKDERYASAQEVLDVLNAPEKEQRESRSHLHARRRFFRGFATVSFVWLCVVAAIILAIATVKLGEVILFDRAVDSQSVEEVVNDNSIVSEEEKKEMIDSIKNEITYLITARSHTDIENITAEISNTVKGYGLSLGLKNQKDQFLVTKVTSTPSVYHNPEELCGVIYDYIYADMVDAVVYGENITSFTVEVNVFPSEFNADALDCETIVFLWSNKEPE